MMFTKRNWLKLKHPKQRWSVAAIAAAMFLCGMIWSSVVLLAGGAVLLCLVLRRVGEDEEIETQKRERRKASATKLEATADAVANRVSGEHRSKESRESRPRTVSQVLATPRSAAALVDELLQAGRYSLLLRPESKQHLTQAQIVRAVRQLDEAMALVPAGRVMLGQLAEQSNSSCGAVDVDPRIVKRNLAVVETVYLDRHCVTNEQFQQFVDAGGYENLEFWHEEALPALLDFVDRTGLPAPRFWEDGQYPDGKGDLPVVAVSWYEAAAYGRWVGKRLPTDAEWTKAGAWPVESSPGRIAQRRYPWGESFDVRRANVYGSGAGRIVPIHEFSNGISVGGIQQLIGNVWEWTDTPLAEIGDSALHVSEAIMSIRGGAFDTYFENQATCHYQSGEHPLSRRGNIGFRLALPMKELESSSETPPEETVQELDLGSRPTERAPILC